MNTIKNDRNGHSHSNSNSNSNIGVSSRYVVVYTHDYGVDIWFRDTERAAKESVYLTVLAWMQDDVGNGDDRRELIDLIKHDEYEEVIEKWQYETGESVIIQRVAASSGPDQTRADFLAVLARVEEGLAEQENEAQDAARGDDDE